MAMVLDRVQRDAIHRFILIDIVRAGTLAVALDEGEDAALGQLRTLLDESMRLLGQIGWEQAGTKERYEVVLSETDRLSIFGRYHERATELINDAMGKFAEEALNETLAVAKVAGDVLSELASSKSVPDESKSPE